MLYWTSINTVSEGKSQQKMLLIFYWMKRWQKIRQGVHQGSILGPLVLLIYINDLPNLASTGTKILLYADNTSIIVTGWNLENFETKIDKIFGDINNWFKVNQLTLKYNKQITCNLIPKIAGIVNWNLTTGVIASKAHQIQNF